jgi:hypothetical protein
MVLVVGHLNHSLTLAPGKARRNGKSAIGHISRLPKFPVEQQEPAILLVKCKAPRRGNGPLTYGSEPPRAVIKVVVMRQTFERSGNITHIHSARNEFIAMAKPMGAARSREQGEEE